VAFPVFVACSATVQSAIVGFELGPRLRRVRRRDAAVVRSASPSDG